jgi:hypothetical protein
MSKFRGVAYWSVATTKGNWLNLAMEALKPIENHQIGLALISEEVINLSFPDGEIHSLKVTGGAGRGTVRQSPNAGVLILCLTALRKAVGDISVVAHPAGCAISLYGGKSGVLLPQRCRA